MIDYIAQALRDELMRKPTPSFDARVMAAIRWGNESRGVRAITNWLVRPQRLSLSPVTAILAAASFIGIAYLGAASAARSMIDGAIERHTAALAAAPAPADDSARKQMVQFVLVAPDAKSVSLVGDFNEWNAKANPLSSTTGNMWTVQVPLTPGRYNYVFMVDGTKLVPDPAAPKAPADEFGQRNSVVTVGSSSND